MKNYSLSKGFTLAEVLITLGIIGVIAALTVPTLISKYSEKVMVSTLKETYSYLSQAYTSAMYEYGSPKSWNLIGFTSGEGAANLTDKLVPYIKIQKNCRNSGSSDLSCLDSFVYKTLSGTDAYNFGSSTSYSKVKLQNGAVLIGQALRSDCSSTLGELKNICGAIMVDVNGNNGPNTWGKDLHRFYVTTQSIIPSGSRYFSSNVSYSFEKACASNNGDIHGAQCTAWVIENGNMDYLRCPEKLSWVGAHSCKEAE